MNTKRHIIMMGLLFAIAVLTALPLIQGCSERETSVGPFVGDGATPMVPERPEGTSAAAGYPETWRSAIIRELAYSLSSTCYSQGRWGQSTRIYDWYGSWFAGDWDYNGLGIGIGGNCKEYGNTIIKRATGNRYSLPSGYDYATGDISTCQQGDVIQRSDIYGIQHTAFVWEVLARDAYGRVTQIDVIDANFVGGAGKRLIARHKLPTPTYKLSQFKVWRP